MDLKLKDSMRSYVTDSLVPAVRSMALDVAIAGRLQDGRRTDIVGGSKMVDPIFLRALSDLLGQDNASFRSVLQADAVVHAVSSRKHTLIVMPVGSGKTLPILMSAVMNKDQITVLIVPLSSMVLDLKERLLRYNGQIKFVVYPDNIDKQECFISDCNLLVVHVDHTLGERFKQIMGGLCRMGKVSRIFLDEAHQVIHDFSYRHSLEQISFLTTFGVPVIGLTGTMAVRAMGAYATRMGLPLTSLACLRAPNSIPAPLKIALRLVKRESDMDLELQNLLSIRLEVGERRIVFVQTVADGEQIAKTHGINCFHAKLPSHLKEEYLSKWKDGDGVHGTIVAMLAMSLGIDYPHVRHIVHYGLPRTAVEYLQECGRGGRDGKPVFCTAIFNRSPNPGGALESDADLGGEYVMNTLFNLQGICPRMVLTRHFDTFAMNCASLPGAVLCEVCEKRKVSLSVMTVLFPLMLT